MKNLKEMPFMPLHDYLCAKCNVLYEIFVSLNELNHTIECPECKERLKRLMGTPYFKVN